jgi:peptidyl-prolyl cis-trans isomerase A (cyclophilin A)
MNKLFLTVLTIVLAMTVNAAEDPKWESKDGMYAVFQTTKGKIVIRLEFEKSPVTVANFVGLAEGTIDNTAKAKGVPYYDGVTFHRCIPGFMIQGGDPAGNGTGGPGYKFGDEFNADFTFDAAGVLAMANAGPNTNGSQFFITHGPQPSLNFGYSIFGHLVEGQSVVTAISNGDKMETVRIVRVGKAAKAFDAPKVFADKVAILEKSQASFKAEKEKKAREAQEKAAAERAKLEAGFDARVKEKFPTAQKTASGLYYVVQKEGNGPQAEKGKKVEVHYTGTLWDGTKFDSSYDRGQPLPFTLGIGQVIAGWDEGIALMKVGGKIKLIIPSKLGYGERGAGGVIPPNADLIFDSELISVQ